MPLSQGDPTIARHDQFMMLNYPRFPVTMVSGRGCELTDAEGGQYLDLFSGFGAGLLGHCHPELVQAATDQAHKLWHVGNLLHTEPQTQLAERIARYGFGGRSYFCHSGSDANEAAFKLARLYGGGERYRILATHGGFHGRGFGAMMATANEKVRAGFEPHPPGFDHVPFNDADALAGAIDERSVAVLVEPIQGEAGIRMPDDGYLEAVRRICDEHDLLLIFDEVWTGCGRTGRWFGHQRWGVTPDIMTLGKAVGGGLPVGVTCATPRVAGLFDVQQHGTVPHATTLGGHCVSMAVSARLFDVIEREGLLERAEELGERALNRLREMADQHPGVTAVRGAGLFLGVELDVEGGRFPKAGDLVRRCLEHGLVVGAAGQSVLRLAPPLIIEPSELDRGLSLLEEALRRSSSG